MICVLFYFLTEKMKSSVDDDLCETIPKIFSHDSIPNRHLKSNLHNLLKEKLTTPRTLEDIANELSRSNGSLNSSMTSVISDSSEPSESGHSSNGGKLHLTWLNESSKVTNSNKSLQIGYF